MPGLPWFNKYPFTNFHELNIDWLCDAYKGFIEKLKEFDTRLTGIETEVDQRLTAMEGDIEDFKAEVNANFATLSANIAQQFSDLESSFDTRFNTLQTALESEMAQLEAEIRADFEAKAAEIDAEITTFENTVNAALDAMEARLDDMDETIQDLQTEDNDIRSNSLASGLMNYYPVHHSYLYCDDPNLTCNEDNGIITLTGELTEDYEIILAGGEDSFPFGMDELPCSMNFYYTINVIERLNNSDPLTVNIYLYVDGEVSRTITLLNSGIIFISKDEYDTLSGIQICAKFLANQRYDIIYAPFITGLPVGLGISPKPYTSVLKDISSVNGKIGNSDKEASMVGMDNEFYTTTDGETSYTTLDAVSFGDIPGGGISVMGTSTRALVYPWKTGYTISGDKYVGFQLDKIIGTSSEDIKIQFVKSGTTELELSLGEFKKHTFSGSYDIYISIVTSDYSIIVYPSLSANMSNKALGDKIAKMAEYDGDYPDMKVGLANNLYTTVGETDEVPYLFRTSGGSIDIGDEENDSLVGCTYPFNQLVQNGNFVDTSNWTAHGSNGTLSASDNELTYTFVNVQNNSYDNTTRQTINTIANHVYFSTYDIDVPYNSSINIFYSNTSIRADFTSGKHTISTIQKPNASATRMYYGVVKASDSGYQAGDTYKISKVMLIDLTAMFGSTIADYIYSLEQGTAGAGVAWLRKLFPKPYYAYNAGSLESVKTSMHRMIGFNAYDNSTGKAKVVGGDQYQITGAYTSLTLDGASISPDGSGYFTPGSSGDITVVGGNSSTTCIHLVWDGERDGEFEEYEEHSYSYPDVLLRGYTVLDAANELKYVGDTIKGSILTRNFAEIDLGDLEWDSDASGFFATITGKKGLGSASAPTECRTVGYDFNYSLSADLTYSEGIASEKVWFRNDSCADAAAFKAAVTGVKFMYPLAVPTTETVSPEIVNPQWVSDWGTEEYVDTRDVPIPVGHETFYRSNLKAKLEMAPDSPGADGLYLVNHHDGINEYIQYISPIPAAPATDGDYTLKATVSNGTITLTWDPIVP